MKLIAPRDASFPNGPTVAAGEEVDIVALAEVLGRDDAPALAADLVEQGWSQPKAKKSAAAKKAAPKTAPAPAGDNTPDEGEKEKP